MCGACSSPNKSTSYLSFVSPWILHQEPEFHWVLRPDMWSLLRDHRFKSPSGTHGFRSALFVSVSVLNSGPVTITSYLHPCNRLPTRLSTSALIVSVVNTATTGIFSKGAAIFILFLSSSPSIAANSTSSPNHVLRMTRRRLHQHILTLMNSHTCSFCFQAKYFFL